VASTAAAKGQLKDGNCYCCLGVLCEVMGVEYDTEASFPEAKILRAAGITDRQSKILANMNDGTLSSISNPPRKLPEGYRDESGATFKSIAKYVRAKL
jgi:hypothetical protein